MTTRNLDRLLAPRSVAVIGATARPRAVGHLVLSNMRAAGFTGRLMPVNPHETEIDGLQVWPDIASLPETPDLAILATPPDTVPGLIAELAARGCAGAVVITAGFGEGGDPDGAHRKQAMLDAARPALLRIIGPNCLGLLAPAAGVNASFSHVQAKTGPIACFTQSGAVAVALLDWATAHDIGFRYLISLGATADVDFGDLLDFVASDPETKAVLLYVESISSARKFMSAARAAARNKPVIVVKSGRHPGAAAAATSHTGALAGSDAVYDAAFRRAGVLRVTGLEQLFAGAETLTYAKPIKGESLTILTNGGGFGVLAADALLDRGGTLAALAPATRAALNDALPRTWSHGNPIDIIGDADGARYAAALAPLLADPTVDAVLALYCPTAVSAAREAAAGLIQAWNAKPAGRSPALLACWFGAGPAEEARADLTRAGIPAFESIATAIDGYANLAEYSRNRRQLLHVPSQGTQDEDRPDRLAAQAVFDAARAAGRDWLDPAAVKDVLRAYGIPVARGRVATTPDEAASIAAEFGGPVALKIHARDIPHKSDVGGVILNLMGGPAVRAAALAMATRVAAARPDAILEGFAIEEMIARPDAFELIAGVSVDPTFGPVVLFGQGGVSVEAVGDTVLALPPLDRDLARALVDRTRVARLLRGFRGRPPVDFEAVYRLLVNVARLALNHREILELDINPFLADAAGVVAVDARIRIGDPAGAIPSAIVPYPDALETEHTLRDGTRLSLRPIRPTDADSLMRLHAMLSPADIRARFHGAMRVLEPSLLVRLSQIDYDREMALIAFAEGDPVPIGVVRSHADPNNEDAEFAVLVRSDWHGRGAGVWLMREIIEHARSKRTGALVGSVLSDNEPMLRLAEELGFSVVGRLDDEVTVRLVLG